VPLAQLEAAGAKMVEQLLQNAPQANAETKGTILDYAWGRPGEDAIQKLVKEHAAKRRSHEAAEGLASFSEKRPARW